MKIGEKHTFFCKLINYWCLNITAERTNITVAHVIGYNEEDIGFIASRCYVFLFLFFGFAFTGNEKKKKNRQKFNWFQNHTYFISGLKKMGQKVMLIYLQKKQY